MFCRIMRLLRKAAVIIPACSFVLLLSVRVNAQSCPSELYVGYYQEDAVTNPEDPLPGSLYLLLPKGEGAFAGDLLFTYAGCQSRNLGRVSGVKTGDSLNGEWAGDVDGTAQSGLFNGGKVGNDSFAGTYTVTGGKQNIVVPNCVDYYIAPFGTWFLSSVSQASPDDELIKFENGAAVWTSVPDSFVTQCGLIDLDEANCNESTTGVWQQTTVSTDSMLAIPSALLTDSNTYTLACSQFDAQGRRLAFSKLTFQYNGPDNSNPAKPIMPPVYMLLDSEDRD